ncbi:MAG: S8 family serine peptidase [Planctomycetes bacterium]|nr:S8 family serine peptidase [Planctomycetota bacterium]
MKAKTKVVLKSILGTRAAMLVALAGVGALSATVEAQQAGGRADVKTLNALARSFDAQFRREHAAAVVWAQGQGLVSVRIDQPGGRIVQLMVLRDGRPIYYATTNANAADSVSADEIQLFGSSGFDLDGTGVGLHIWDGGAVRTTHQELTGRVTLMDLVGQSSHSTHVAGTMIAKGVTTTAHGMANKATLTSYDFFNDTAEMAGEGANAVVSNHSYGPISGWDFGNIGPGWFWLGDVAVSTTEDPNFGRYGTSASNWDQIAFNAPRWLIVKSAGNQRTDTGPAPGTVHRHLDNGSFVSDTDSHPADGGATGYDTISREGNAKNILTVGAVNDVIGGYSGPGSVTMSSFSSWGPTDDGRIKPDLVGNGVGLFSSVAGNDGDYATFTGTSMSSPNVAGSLALLIQHYRETHGGADMRSATLKGLAIHTTDETGAAPGPDYSFGWGLLNALTAANLVQVDVTNPDAIQELNLSQGQTISQVHTYNGSGPFKATLCWTDPPGAAQPYVVDSPTRVLVNDLDLRVIGTSGTELPWILDGANPGNAATKGDNIRDNVEVVIIDAPMAGDYTVQISHKGTLSGGSQDFSLILTGIPTNVPTGACCRQGGLVCSVEADPGCLALSGNFKGDGTTCADDNSDGIADECEEDQVLEVKFSQPPDEDGEDMASNIDWIDEDPNVVLADDFISDGRPITTVRWWGSNLDEEAIDGPDGWFISFHKPLVALVSSAFTGVSSAPPQPRSLREDPGPGATWVRTCEGCSASFLETNHRVGGEPARRSVETSAPAFPSLQSTALNPSEIGAAAAVASADFQWDDGTAEICIGVNSGPPNNIGQPFGWANQFTNTSGMSLTLIEIEVAFGCGGAGALAVGDAVDAVIWVDAAATGDMVNATKAVQWSLPGGVHNTSASSFATHTIPGGVTIPVGAQFYVGLGDVQSVIDSQIRFPASLDQTTTAGRSWAFFSDSGVFDPDDLASQDVDLIDNFGLPGNWLIRANAAEFPREPLALYYCNADVVDATTTALGACDAHPVIEYVSGLAACCLVHAIEDSRTMQTPGQAVAFFEERCLHYAIDIQAVVGHAFVDDGKDGCAEVATGLTAVADFWGWHSTGVERGAEFGLQSALQSEVSMSGSDWLYGPWSAATPVCSQPNMAFELLTTEPSAQGDSDANGNSIVDECEIVIPDVLLSAPNPFGLDGGGDLNHVAGLAAPTSVVAGAGGLETTIRIRLAGLYAAGPNACPVRTTGTDLSQFVNQLRYLGPPVAFEDNDASAPKFIASRLQCTPYYRDWSSTILAAEFGAGVDVETIYFFGAEVMPCSRYEAQQATENCINFDSEDCFSPPLEIKTALWGDVWPPFGDVSFTDIGKIVDAFKSIPFVEGNPPAGAPKKVRAMLRGNIAPLDSSVNFTDIGNVVSAFKTIAYAEDGPTACP